MILTVLDLFCSFIFSGYPVPMRPCGFSMKFIMYIFKCYLLVYIIVHIRLSVFKSSLLLHVHIVYLSIICNRIKLQYYPAKYWVCLKEFQNLFLIYDLSIFIFVFKKYSLNRRRKRKKILLGNLMVFFRMCVLKRG